MNADLPAAGDHGVLPDVAAGLGWRGATGIVALVVLSFVAAQCLVVCAQRLRFRRVLAKSAELSERSALPPAPDGAVGAGGDTGGEVESSTAEDGAGEGGVLDASSDAGAAAGAGKRIPITLVTGFLGAGKTTLLNHILSSDAHGLRIAVVVNEFGAVSVDHRLIRSKATAGTLADVAVLKNGCMCCSGESPGSELEGILNKLLEMAKVDPDLYDYMLIETSGLADPTAIVHLLFRHEMARSRFVLDGVVTLVDATNVHRHLPVPAVAPPPARPRPEVARQIALADVVLLTKTDALGHDAAAGTPGSEFWRQVWVQWRGRGRAGADPSAEGAPESSAAAAAAATAAEATAKAIRDAIRVACPAVTIVTAHPSRAPLDRLLGIDAFRRRRVRIARGHPPRHSAPHAVGAQTVCLQVEGALSLEKLQRWLQDVVSSHESELYRLKGTVSIAGEARSFVVQGVHGEVRGHFADEDDVDVDSEDADASAGENAGRTGAASPGWLTSGHDGSDGNTVLVADPVRGAEDEPSSVLVLIAATGPAPDFAYLLDEELLEASLQACAEEEPGGGVAARVMRMPSGRRVRRAPPPSAVAAADECGVCAEDDRPGPRKRTTTARS